MKMKKTYIWMISMIITIITALVNVSSKETGGSIYGFPVDIAETYRNPGMSLHVWGFLLNLVFFYFILQLISRIFLRTKE